MAEPIMAPYMGVLYFRLMAYMAGSVTPATTAVTAVEKPVDFGLVSFGFESDSQCSNALIDVGDDQCGEEDGLVQGGQRVSICIR